MAVASILLTGQLLNGALVSPDASDPQTSPPPRWQRRPEARPEEILDAALEVFGEQGFARARLEDVAQRAGVSKGTLYLYFDSKETLFREMVRAKAVAALREGAAFVEAFQGSHRDLLTEFLRRMYRVLQEQNLSRISRLVQAELASFPELAHFYSQEVILPARRLVESIITRGIEAGEFRAHGSRLRLSGCPDASDSRGSNAVLLPALRSRSPFRRGHSRRSDRLLSSRRACAPEPRRALMIRPWLVLGALVTLFAPAAGQQPPAPAAPSARLTLLEAIRIGRERGVAALLARINARIADSRIGEARAGILPTISGTAAYSRQTQNLQEFGLSFPGLRSRLPTFRSGAFGLGASQTLFDASVLARLKAARDSAVAAGFDARAVGEIAGATAGLRTSKFRARRRRFAPAKLIAWSRRPCSIRPVSSSPPG